jgi:hypothetical protein
MGRENPALQRLGDMGYCLPIVLPAIGLIAGDVFCVYVLAARVHPRVLIGGYDVPHRIFAPATIPRRISIPD